MLTTSYAQCAQLFLGIVLGSIGRQVLMGEAMDAAWVSIAASGLTLLGLIIVARCFPVPTRGNIF
jgi:hypothetical protein